MRVSMHALAITLGILVLIGEAAGAAPEPADRVFRRSEVVFMYAADAEAYRAYGATFVAWGGANTAEAVTRHHEMGIRCTGSVWCLTAGAQTLHDNAVLREAVAIDIEGKPIAVPWQFDKVYRGQTTDFGNTNHPAFREHVKAKVRQVMAGGADGLHVDDHLGVAHPALWHGGGFDDHSIAGFRKYLAQHATKAQLEAAGVDDLDTFDYRTLVRRYATTRDEVKRRQRQIPLFDLWKRYHLEAAASFVEELRAVAEQAAGHPVWLSANAGLASEYHRYVVPRLTHVVCEVWFNGHTGVGKLEGAMNAYAAADRLGRPLACTASGHDWAHVKAHDARDLPRFWIALTYAHGHCFMTPHPTRQWCFNQQLGTHWYAAPIDAYAPLYQFIGEHARYFDGFDLAEADVAAPPSVLAVARRKGGATVLHVINRDYDTEHHRMRPQADVRLTLPARLVGEAERATILRYDAPPRTIELTADGDGRTVVLPELPLWALLVFE